MKIRFALLCLGLSATAAAADVSQAPSPQAQSTTTALTGTPGIATAKPQGMYRVPSPTVSQTSVTRRPDGSLVMNCVQRPNPKLQEQMAAQQAAPNLVEPRQP